MQINDADWNRFLKYVPRHPDENGCLIWLGARTRAKIGGKVVETYGFFWLNGTMHRAHRVMWMALRGEIPPEKPCVLHACDVPGCVNPHHLFLGTMADNMKDRDEKGRQVTPTGERNGRAKNSDADVAEAISLYQAGGISQREVAERFGVGMTTVHNWVNGIRRS